ncbi:MAG TPA: terminase small subunit [Chitinophagaceae bacterium]|nr:terminase small subunit [Chitinophagaceae bacterium]
MSYRLQPADVQAKWEEYRYRCDNNIATVRYRDKLVQVPKPIIYTLEGFCLFLDLSEEELTRFENNKNYKACFKKIRYQVMCRKMAALVNGEGNARALIFDLKVNHGIDPKQAREETDWKITLNLNHDAGPDPAVVINTNEQEEENAEEEDAGAVNEEPSEESGELYEAAAAGRIPVNGTEQSKQEIKEEKGSPPLPLQLKTGFYSIW